MTDETLTPIASTPIARSTKKSIPVGRRADRLAALLACLGAVLSVIAAIWFFLGFAENDTRPEHLTSAFVLTLILFAFAILPFALVTRFALHAYRKGTRSAHLLWTLFLMLPWVILGSLAISHTPLPIWCGLVLTGLAGLLSLWAVISFILDRNSEPAELTVNTDMS